MLSSGNERCYLNDKTEFNALDLGRVFFALLIMCIHLNPFRDFSPEFNYLFRNIPARLGVPFFFITAGFFLNGKITDREKTFSYLKRLVRMYIICTLLYLPAIIYFYKRAEYSPIRYIVAFVQDFFVMGSYVQLWYFLSLIMAVFVLYILIKSNLSDKQLLTTAIIIYGLGAAGNVFAPELINIPVFRLFYKLFGTTRCGLFFGFPLVCIGFLIRKYSHIIPKRSYIPPALLFFILLIGEVFVIRHAAGENREAEVWFMLLPCSISVFLFFCCLPMPGLDRRIALHCRKLSVILFELHNLVSFALSFILFRFKLPLNSLENFFAVLVITVFLGEIIIYLSEKKAFAFLKVLF